MPYDEWEEEPTPGWAVGYRIVERRAWFPCRIDGRWRWRVRHFALQATYLDENPPAPWITVTRSVETAPLMRHVRARREREHLRHARQEGRHAIGH